MDQPKLERLLRLMKLLTANTTYNVDQLAERLQMSRRTIYRYIDTFREAGFVIKKAGDCIRLDKESPHFRDISQLVHFTEEEAVILKSAIENIDDTNLLKQNLKRKLYSVYDNKTLADTVVRGKNAPNIRTLIEAIDRQRQAILHSYQSPHGGEVRDRRVEPFAFTTNYVQVWCYDPEAGACKLFKTSRIGSVELTAEAWEHGAEHREGFIDVFRMHGGARHRVRLELGLLAYNLLCEEYPLAERDVRPLGRGRWLLDTQVAGFAGVGRFAVGLLDDIRIVDSPELTAYIRDYIAANKFYKIFSYICNIHKTSDIMKINTIATLGVLCTALAAGSCCRQTPRTTETLPAAAAVVLQDYGTEPTVLNIESYTLGNENFRTVLWTGNNLQVTLMTIPVGGDVGLEQHMGIDQFLRIEEGMAQVLMGDSQDKLDFVRDVEDDYAIFVPAGKWHNIVNKGDKPLKLYSIYAPAEHPHGTVHKTQQEAMEAEHAH